MNQNERQLFKELCKYKSGTFKMMLLPYATPHVLGQLFFNRMQGIAYGTLQQCGLLASVNREFRNSLRDAYEKNLEKNQSYTHCVQYTADILSQCSRKTAMLKGAYLCAHYPAGYRTSNDIDLLVLPGDVTVIGNMLREEGFLQGKVRNGVFLPATREEIIQSKMMRGETVPFIKEMNLPGMKYLEVDLNFSLDYKNGETDVLSTMLDSVCIKEENGMHIPTLCPEDFFIHLCVHLYKEATTLPWIEMHRDMTLYKYCDIYTLLSEMTEADITRVFTRAEQLGLHRICAYAILETAGLFDMTTAAAAEAAHRILGQDPAFLLTVVSPKDKKTFVYKTAGVEQRFFMENRALDLKEVKPNEKT